MKVLRGHDTVGMGMVLEFLIPGVENAEESDLDRAVLGRGRFRATSPRWPGTTGHRSRVCSAARAVKVAAAM